MISKVSQSDSNPTICMIMVIDSPTFKTERRLTVDFICKYNFLFPFVTLWFSLCIKIPFYIAHSTCEFKLIVFYMNHPPIIIILEKLITTQYIVI